jgi:hypothetical protein
MPEKTTTTAAPVFVPNVASAIADIQKTLNWLILSTKEGGAGFTVAKAKDSNAYQALVALGGTWAG